MAGAGRERTISGCVFSVSALQAQASDVGWVRNMSGNGTCAALRDLVASCAGHCVCAVSAMDTGTKTQRNTPSNATILRDIFITDW